jgi:sec-independent protein translocase protein TatB
MFANIGWGEMLLLVVVGLVVLGPERLPGAIRWTSGAVRQARDYLSGATSALREDLGPEFEDLKQPLGELQKLRGMTPRAALTKHLLDGDDSWLTGEFDKSAVKGQSAAMPAVNGQGAAMPAVNGQGAAMPSAQSAPDGAAPVAPAQPASSQATPSAGATAPFDSDAT